ncbi:MAG: hypothetical protein IPO63_08600 [Bacteroidetes bacterium]|nr:hypothetical protein [Bacteroidota bacterium]
MKYLEKSWAAAGSGQKKFLASILTYGLSKKLKRKDFEAVNESYIDLKDSNSEQPDVVVYDLNNNFTPAIAIECVTGEDLPSTIRSMEILSGLYHISESFVLDIEQFKWYRISNNKVESNSYSRFFSLDLKEVLDTLIQRNNRVSASI